MPGFSTKLWLNLGEVLMAQEDQKLGLAYLCLSPKSLPGGLSLEDQKSANPWGECLQDITVSCLEPGAAVWDRPKRQTAWPTVF
jgi:hypothetical protein